jgi:hypothetical protein
VTNNIILKKLRVAFELKEDDMHAILKAAEFPVSKPELSALFRKFGHTNYRPCGDQLLRNFLKGLTLRFVRKASYTSRPSASCAPASRRSSPSRASRNWRPPPGRAGAGGAVRPG